MPTLKQPLQRHKQMITLLHWSSQFTPVKCSYGDCDKCMEQIWAAGQVIFSLNEGSVYSRCAWSQTATGSWLLSIVFDRRTATRDFWIGVTLWKSPRTLFFPSFLPPPFSSALNKNSLLKGPFSGFTEKVSGLVCFYYYGSRTEPNR